MNSTQLLNYNLGFSFRAYLCDYTENMLPMFLDHTEMFAITAMAVNAVGEVVDRMEGKYSITPINFTLRCHPKLVPQHRLISNDPLHQMDENMLWTIEIHLNREFSRRLYIEIRRALFTLFSTFRCLLLRHY